MEVIYIDKVAQIVNEPCCVALGFFDGLHRGHLALMDKVKVIAKEKGLKKAMLTFSEHPKSYLKHVPFPSLTTLEDKIEIMKSLDFDYLFVIPFTKDFASKTPEQFIENYICTLQMKHIVCGFDYHFGSHGKGNVSLLQKYSFLGYQVSVVDKLEDEGMKISSTYIRQLLMEGAIDKANHYLGREYQIRGEVIYGRQIGRTQLGFATANVEYKDYLLPKRGVYGSRVIINDKEYIGMTNIGYNPTFGDLDKPSLEVHIFDFDEDIYGKIIRVYFSVHIRDEKKFSSKEELITQLHQDQETIRLYFKQK